MYMTRISSCSHLLVLFKLHDFGLQTVPPSLHVHIQGNQLLTQVPKGCTDRTCLSCNHNVERDEPFRLVLLVVDSNPTNYIILSPM